MYDVDTDELSGVQCSEYFTPPRESSPNRRSPVGNLSSRPEKYLASPDYSPPSRRLMSGGGSPIGGQRYLASPDVSLLMSGGGSPIGGQRYLASPDVSLLMSGGGQRYLASPDVSPPPKRLMSGAASPIGSQRYLISPDCSPPSKRLMSGVSSEKSSPIRSRRVRSVSADIVSDSELIDTEPNMNDPVSINSVNNSAIINEMNDIMKDQNNQILFQNIMTGVSESLQNEDLKNQTLIKNIMTEMSQSMNQGLNSNENLFSWAMKIAQSAISKTHNTDNDSTIKDTNNIETAIPDDDKSIDPTNIVLEI